MAEERNRAAAREMFAAWERWDLDTIEALVAPDAVDRRPQSGERFVGRANIMGMYREVPGPPRIRWDRVRGGPDLWVAQGLVDYGEGAVHLIGIVEFANGMAVAADFFFADPFEPPAARAPWNAPLAPPSP